MDFRYFLMGGSWPGEARNGLTTSGTSHVIGQGDAQLAFSCPGLEGSCQFALVILGQVLQRLWYSSWIVTGTATWLLTSCLSCWLPGLFTGDEGVQVPAGCVSKHCSYAWSGRIPSLMVLCLRFIPGYPLDGISLCDYIRTNPFSCR